MKFLQCGHDKSGTYLLYKILSLAQKQTRHYKSFMQRSGVGTIIDTHLSRTKRYPEVNEVDHIRRTGDTWTLNFPSPICRHIPLDINLLINTSSLVYTHEKPSRLQPFRDRFTHRYYLIRDGRDVINSLMHFLTDDISRQLVPEYKISDPQVLYNDLEYFSRLVTKWAEHVSDYLQHAEDYILIHFEQLSKNPLVVLDQIKSETGLDFDFGRITEETSFGHMKQTAPAHLRKGRAGDWRNYFSARHKEIFKAIAGHMLTHFEYEPTMEW